jgi:hypothetical protein
MPTVLEAVDLAEPIGVKRISGLVPQAKYAEAQTWKRPEEPSWWSRGDWRTSLSGSVRMAPPGTVHSTGP